MSEKSDVTLEDIVSLCKRRGFIFQGSEVYGGLAGTWDYGPLGTTLKKNLMDLWWKTFVEDRDDMVGVDAAILMNPTTWKASGHVDTFEDPVVECGNCGNRERADHLIEQKKDLQEIKRVIKAKLDVFEELEKKYYEDGDEALPSQKKFTETLLDKTKLVSSESTQKIIKSIIGDSRDEETIMPARLYLLLSDFFLDIFSMSVYLQNINCKVCGLSQWSEVGKFNMMFDTTAGPLGPLKRIPIPAIINRKTGKVTHYIQAGINNVFKSDEGLVYLRPETAQGIFTNFKNVVDTLYPDVPFGIAQIGKAFRNEISPRDFVFRSREFNQMEIEYFIHEENWDQLFEQWRLDISKFLETAGVDSSKLHELEVEADDLAHYSKRTIDYEFEYPHGKDELLGLAYRTDFDLQNIQRESGKKMEYRPKEPGKKPFVPHVIEPSFGVERLIMAVLVSAFKKDVQNGEERIYLALPEHIAPVRYCVSPLLKNKPELVDKAKELYKQLRANGHAIMWDDNGNIGKRYRRQDEIGTPECIVVDFDTLEDDTVTIRDRDTTEQRRVKISELITQSK